MRIGVISDTHGLLRPEALERLAGADLILHAGDIGAPDIVPRLAALAPVSAIRGNVDAGAWASALPETVTLELGGCLLHMLHDVHDLAIDAAAAGVRVVVSGHSHRPGIRVSDGVLHLNPGSAGRRRFRLPVTVATLDLTSGEPSAEIHDLAPPR